MRNNKTSGLTLIEVLIIAPIVMIVIGVFVGLIVALTGEVIASRVNNIQSYTTQDALNRIEQDVKLSSGFLATNQIVITSPQGYDDGTAAFHNANATTGTMLILNMYGISKSPTDQNRNVLYLKDSPNSCASGKASQNTPLLYNVVYFVKNNNLIRRVIARSDYAANNCDPSTKTTIAPWQLPTCTPGYSNAFCKSSDETLVTGIASTDGFVIKYFVANNISPLADASDGSKADTVRQTSLNTANTITATINTSTTAAGREVKQSGNIRAAKYNTTSLNSISCPAGFIVVPGSSTYGTNDFCIMKYEAKADNNGDGVGDTTYTTGYNTWPADTYPISASRKLVSSAAGYPVANISQTTAISTSSTAGNVYGCNSGCHLVTEAEWMTLAQNVLSVASNWSGGAVGSGHIYNGHNDRAPDTALVADTSDSNGYAGETNINGNQRRTLTLTNGQVIWDLAGNVYEFTSATIGAHLQPGLTGDSQLISKEWNNSSLLQNGLPNTSMPASTGIAGNSAWDNAKGIGMLYSNYNDANVRSFCRGGNWTIFNSSGILALQFTTTTSQSLGYAGGFRVAK